MWSDPYEVLGVSPGATDADVQRAWRRVSKRVHPDVGGSPEEFRAALEAYHFLRSRGATPDSGGGASPTATAWVARPHRTASTIVAVAMAIVMMVIMLFAPAVLVLQR